MDEPKDDPKDDNANKRKRERRPVTREASERLHQIREEIMKDRNGKPFEDSVELLRREREKRTEYLMQVVTGQYGKDPYEEDTLDEAITEDTPKEQS